MKIWGLLLGLTIAGTPVAAIIDRTTVPLPSSISPPPPSPTIVYTTITLPGGALQTNPLTYVQSFTSMYNVVQTPKSGSIGLGTIKGSVGVVRPTIFETLTSSS